MSHCCGGSKETTVINVTGMTCGHCKASVEKAVSALEGVSKAEVNLDAKNVSITYDPAKVNAGTVKKAITEAGYEVQ